MQNVYFRKQGQIMYHCDMSTEKSGINVEALEWAMEKKKWQAANLSRASKVNKSTISLLLDGKVPGVSAGIVGRLARALEVSTDFLMGFTTNPDPKPAMDMAIVEIVTIANTLSEFRQRDLLLIAQAYQDADEPTEEMLENILKIVEEVAGEETRHKLAAALAARRAAAKKSRRRPPFQNGDEESQGE